MLDVEAEEELRSGRDLGIADVPTESVVRLARLELGLDVDKEQFDSLMQLRVESRGARLNDNGATPLWGREDFEEEVSVTV